jgi:ABC-2 type transport system ATP-binding protein
VQVTALIRKLAREDGIMVFMCTHNLPLAEGICDTFGFISRGELVRTGGREDLIESTRQNVT